MGSTVQPLTETILFFWLYSVQQRLPILSELIWFLKIESMLIGKLSGAASTMP